MPFLPIRNSFSRAILDTIPIDVFSIASSGNLSTVSGSPFSGGSSNIFAGGVIIDPAGKFLYFSTRNGFEIFTIDDQSGSLEGIAGSPFNESNQAVQSVMDTSGKFIYTNNNPTDGMAVSGFAVDSISGTVSVLPNSPFATIPDSTGALSNLLISGQFLFHNSPANNEIEAWRIDESTGNITSVPGSPFATGMNPSFFVADPEGKFLYVLNVSDATISVFSIDPTSGVLAQISGSPFSAVSGTGITIDPSGKFLYVITPNGIDHDFITGFNLDTTTGKLTASSQSPYQAFVTVIGSGQLLPVKLH